MMEPTELEAIAGEMEDLKSQMREQIRAELEDEFVSVREHLEREHLQLQKRTMQWNAVVEMLRKILLQTGDNLVLDPKDWGCGWTTPDIPKDQAHFIDIAYQYMKMGRDFDVLLKAIMENELLKAQWNKMTMSLRLVQE